jgi:UDP-N-acetylglucosamine 3-dehydrogenase
MLERRLKGLVVGLGVMGGYHQRVLAAMPDQVELVGAVDPNQERRAHAAGLYPHIPTHPDLASALAAGPVDFAALAAPVAYLPALAAEAIGAGLSVMVEKPMAPSEQEAITMLQAAHRAGVVLSVGHVERFNPAVVALGERLRTGDAGRIFQIHARRLSPFPFRESMTGVSLDLATHDIDVIRYLTGSEIARVYAETASRSPTSAEDLLSASLRLDDDTTGVLEVNWLTPAKVRQLSVTAEAGMFVVDYVTQDLFFYENPRVGIDWDALALVRGTGEGNMTRFAIDRREPLRVEWDSFLTAVRGEGPPAVSGFDGLAAMSTARAVQRSGAEHAAVRPGYRDMTASAELRTPGAVSTG